MIIAVDNNLSFALEAKSAQFMYEKEDRVVASFPVSAGYDVPISLEKHGQQMHLSAHLPFIIKGDTAWEAYEELAADPENAFHLWMDPMDGETKYCAALREATAEELDFALAKAEASMSHCWPILERFSNQSGDEDGDDREGVGEAGTLADLFGMLGD